MLKFQAFIFESFEFFPEEKRLDLRYSFDSEIFFEEKIFFNFEFIGENYKKETLEKAFFGLWVMSGISYFKIFCPSKIKFKNNSLHPDQKEFFEKIYRQGLGEFFYQNNLDPKNKINFCLQKSLTSLSRKKEVLTKAPVNPQSENFKVLVPLGGGKDSLTTIDLLQKNNFDFETITVDSDPRFEAVSGIIGKPHIEVKRLLDPKIFEINKYENYRGNSVYNGHVPISSIWSFIFISTAILRGNKFVALSNENSANECTTEYGGEKINHQYSKSLEYERDFQAYVKKFVTGEVVYFSLLRPLSELKIAEIFCGSIFEKYKNYFSSCNKNFKIQKNILNKNLDQKKFYWCGDCSKCAFVFLIFSPFLDREKLIDLFGQNLFLKKSLIPEYEALLGLTETKPFECVGEVEEVRLAFALAEKSFPEVRPYLDKLEAFRTLNLRKNNFQKSSRGTLYDYKKLYEQSMPDMFFEIFKKGLDSYKKN